MPSRSAGTSRQAPVGILEPRVGIGLDVDDLECVLALHLALRFTISEKADNVLPHRLVRHDDHEPVIASVSEAI